VLASGTGSLLQAILDAQDERFRVVVVVSDRPGVECLARAERAGVPAEVVDFKAFEIRDEFSKAVAGVEVAHDVELSVHAGFMRILTKPFFEALGRPAMNSHPALLPSFPGAHGIREAIEWGAKVTGTTIHFVDEEVDHGPIILQESVPILSDDTEETLHERVKVLERRLYPQAIRLFASDRLKVEGRRVHILE
jgi:phosphoribosylglycinamide formyltransferase 1